MNLSQLWQEMVRAINRTRKNRGEEGDIGGKIQQATRLDMFPMNFNHITDELKRKETDTNGQYDIECAPADMESSCLQ